MKRVQVEDCEKIGKLEFIDWYQFCGKKFLITGSTGLIGSNLVNAIAYNSRQKKLNIKIILPVRNLKLAEEMFRWTGAEIIPYESSTLKKIANVDYVIHLGPTSSKYFAENPVDTMLVNLESYKALLEWCVGQQIKKFIGISTMEVYGYPNKGHEVRENELGAFETMNARNSYPIAKIACETLCNSFYVQYNVPIVILRATQTFGPGVKYDDSRVFAQFMRCVVENKDIVLKSEGLTERDYLYTADMVSAILLSALRAKPGQAYSVANPSTYCSIKEMAELVSNEVAGGKITVLFDIAKDIEKLGYAKTLYMNLNVDKIKKLGWKPYTGLKEMFERMILGL